MSAPVRCGGSSEDSSCLRVLNPDFSNRRTAIRSHPSHRGSARQRQVNDGSCHLFRSPGGISRDSGHEVRSNRTAFRAPRTSPAFVNKTNPPDTVVADNDWQATLDWPALARASLFAPADKQE